MVPEVNDECDWVAYTFHHVLRYYEPPALISPSKRSVARESEDGAILFTVRASAYASAHMASLVELLHQSEEMLDTHSGILLQAIHQTIEISP